VVLDTQELRARFTSKGAVLSRLKLKNHYVRAGLSKEEKSLEENWLEVLRPMEGVPSLTLGDPSRGSELEDALWIEATPAGERTKTMAYEFAPGDGLRYRKEFEPAADGLSLLYRVIVRNQSPELAGKRRALLVGATSGIAQEHGASQFFTPFAAVAKGTDVLRLEAHFVKLDDLLKGTAQPIPGGGGVLWTATFAKYFVATLEPRELRRGGGGRGEALEVEEVGAKLRKDDEAVATELRERGLEADPAARARAEVAHRTAIGQTLKVPLTVPEVGGQSVLEFRLFTGPRATGTLSREENRTIQPVLRLDPQGFCIPCLIDPMVRALLPLLLGLLGFFHSITWNWGVAIILLTVLVRLVLFPLSRMQQVSMHRYGQKVQKLKPELDRLREKHKNNRQKMNQEVMALYKAHGVNPVPLAGCLPMLINLPVFIGLFYTLRTAAELRHAPFMLWIKDLSMPDALMAFKVPHNVLFFTATGLHVLPILMTVTWYLQQRMTPLPADPQQAQTQKMMRIMPIFFGLLLYEYASGLSLYMFTSSLLGIFEQQIIKKRWLQPIK
jgi:YidC/Oxa1 family membrane protein insertase